MLNAQAQWRANEVSDSIEADCYVLDAKSYAMLPKYTARNTEPEISAGIVSSLNENFDILFFTVTVNSALPIENPTA